MVKILTQPSHSLITGKKGGMSVFWMETCPKSDIVNWIACQSVFPIYKSGDLFTHYKRIVAAKITMEQCRCFAGLRQRTDG